MHTFKDTGGREWTVELTIGSARRVKSLAGVDLLNPHVPAERKGASPKVAGVVTLMSDLETLGDVLFAICKPQAEERDVSDEQFADLFNADTVEEATEALRSEMLSFFQRRGHSEKVAVMQKVDQAIQAARREATAKTEAFDVESRATTMVSQAFETAGESSPSSPESSGSTPTPGPSETSSTPPKGD